MKISKDSGEALTRAVIIRAVVMVEDAVRHFRRYKMLKQSYSLTTAHDARIEAQSLFGTVRRNVTAREWRQCLAFARKTLSRHALLPAEMKGDQP